MKVGADLVGRNRLTSLLNPFGETTTWAYDAASRATTMTLGTLRRAQADRAEEAR